MEVLDPDGYIVRVWDERTMREPSGARGDLHGRISRFAQKLVHVQQKRPKEVNAALLDFLLTTRFSRNAAISAKRF
jgi:hypothetical protein